MGPDPDPEKSLGLRPAPEPMSSKSPEAFKQPRAAFEELGRRLSKGPRRSLEGRVPESRAPESALPQG